MVALTVFVAYQLLNAVFLLSIAFAARLLWVRVEQIEFGIGPPIRSTGLFRFNWIPVDGKVGIRDEDLGTLKDGEVADFAGRLRVLLIALFAASSLLVYSLTILGTEAFTVLLNGFKQILMGLWSPHDSGLAELRKFDEFVRANDSDAVAAIIAMKLLALNLLPSGSIGAQIWWTLFPFCRDRKGVFCGLIKSVLVTLLMAILVIWPYLLIRHYILGI